MFNFGTLPCPVCGGKASMLGALGNVAYFSCRDCGNESYVSVTETPGLAEAIADYNAAIDAAYDEEQLRAALDY